MLAVQYVANRDLEFRRRGACFDTYSAMLPAVLVRMRPHRRANPHAFPVGLRVVALSFAAERYWTGIQTGRRIVVSVRFISKPGARSEVFSTD